MRSPRLYLQDILDAIRAIERFVEGLDFDAFAQDDLRASAVIRKLEVIGEASRQVPGWVRERYPEVPWRTMAGMRDRLIHAYFGVKLDLVWETIRRDLPPLKRSLDRILSEMEGPPSTPA